MICAGPILTIVGLVYLVSATTDTRGEKIDQFNAASAPDILYQRTFGVPWPFEFAPPFRWSTSGTTCTGPRSLV